MLTLIVPAFNEATALKHFAPDLSAFATKNGFKIILVNDGSKDDTIEVLKSLESPSFHIIQHKKNKGYGAALKSGIAACDTPYLITLDGDGQHRLEDVLHLYQTILTQEADLIVGSRNKSKIQSNWYRTLGKKIIRSLAQFLMPIPISDLNSGMKIYQTELAQKYAKLCPDSMAFSDIITLCFINQKHLVLEHPIEILQRDGGKSTINTKTAIDTFQQIVHIVMLFRPTRIFFPPAIFIILLSLAWNVRIFMQGSGLSVGSLLGILTGLLMIVLGLLAEQLSLLRREIAALKH